MAAAYGSVLLVARDPGSRPAVDRAFLREGLEPLWADRLPDAERLLTTRRPCLVVLDADLSPEDAWLVLRRLRRARVPVLLATDRPDPTLDRLALRLGAEDCVSWQQGPESLVLRARLVLGRTPPRALPPLGLGALVVDPSGASARVGARRVPLTPTECALLAALVEAGGRVVPRDELVARARARAGALPLARSIEAHVRSLRRKLGDDPRRPRWLLTVRGFGYRLVAPDAPDPGALAEAAFDALPDALIVVDADRRVRRLNRAAAALAGLPADRLVDRLTCAALLRCQNDRSAHPCPALAACAGAAPVWTEVVLRPRGEPLVMEERAARLSGTPATALLHLRERPRD